MSLRKNDTAKRLATGMGFALLLLWFPSAMAQDTDLQEARRAILDSASKQVSALQSAFRKVPLERITEAIRAQEEGRNTALGAISRAETGQISKEEGVARAYDAVNQGTQKHLDVLKDLYDKVPEQAKPAIDRAYKESQMGRNKALSTLSAIRQGHTPSGQAGIGRGEEYRHSQRPGASERGGIFSGSERRGGPPFSGRAGGFERPSRPSRPGGFGGGRPGGFRGGGRGR